MDGWKKQFKESDAFHTSPLETLTGQTVLRPSLRRSEKLQSPIEKCTFPGDNSEAAGVLNSNGTTHLDENQRI